VGCLGYTDISAERFRGLPQPLQKYTSTYTKLGHDRFSRYSDGLLAEGPGFDSRQGHDFYILYSVQTGSGAHLASYTVSTGGDFLIGKVAGT
jgi:hypothetical protein